MELPEGFRKRYEQMLGGEAAAFFDACARPLRKSLKVNTSKVSIADYEARAKANGWELTPIPWSPGGFWIDRENRAVPLGKSVEHYGGWFYLQEASSMIPAEVLFGRPVANPESRIPSPGIMLDMAAAPGGKTLQLAGALGQSGIVISNDIVMDRVRALVANIERAGALNIGVTMYNGNQFGNLLSNTFDRVLLDAPCTGEGTIRKDRDALENWSMRGIEKMARTQAPLAASAFKALKPGGVMVYSTCTLSPEENEAIVESLLRKFPGNAEVVEWELPGLITAGSSSSIGPEPRIPNPESRVPESCWTWRRR
ncbi:MAG: NOL1/NOP2/sun family putative RNA methylase, partial [bacterium]